MSNSSKPDLHLSVFGLTGRRTRSREPDPSMRGQRRRMKGRCCNLSDRSGLSFDDFDCRLVNRFRRRARGERTFAELR